MAKKAKKIFIVAKELGVHYQELLKGCKEIGLTGRNYMSTLSDEEYNRLLRHVQGGSEQAESEPSAPPPAEEAAPAQESVEEAPAPAAG